MTSDRGAAAVRSAVAKVREAELGLSFYLDAEARLQRFTPLLARFPELERSGAIIEPGFFPSSVSVVVLQAKFARRGVFSISGLARLRWTAT